MTGVQTCALPIYLLVNVIEDEALSSAPWQCQDPDDQVFLNLAYTSKPSVLLSKDNELLKLAKKAVKEGVIITSNYLIA